MSLTALIIAIHIFLNILLNLEYLKICYRILTKSILYDNQNKELKMKYNINLNHNDFLLKEIKPGRHDVSLKFGRKTVKLSVAKDCVNTMIHSYSSDTVNNISLYLDNEVRITREIMEDIENIQLVKKYLNKYRLTNLFK